MRGIGDGILVRRGVCAARGGVLVGVLAASAAAHCVLMWRDWVGTGGKRLERLVSGFFKFEGQKRNKISKNAPWTDVNFTRPRKTFYRGTICFPLLSPLEKKQKINSPRWKKINGVRCLYILQTSTICTCGFIGERDGGEGPPRGSGGIGRSCRGTRRYRGRRRGFREWISASLETSYTTLHHHYIICFLSFFLSPSSLSHIYFFPLFTPYNPYIYL